MTTEYEERRALLRRRIARAEEELGIDNRTPAEQVADQFAAAEAAAEVEELDANGRRRPTSAIQAEALMQSRTAGHRAGYWSRSI